MVEKSEASRKIVKRASRARRSHPDNADNSGENSARSRRMICFAVETKAVDDSRSIRAAVFSSSVVAIDILPFLSCLFTRSPFSKISKKEFRRLDAGNGELFTVAVFQLREQRIAVDPVLTGRNDRCAARVKRKAILLKRLAEPLAAAVPLSFNSLFVLSSDSLTATLPQLVLVHAWKSLFSVRLLRQRSDKTA